MFENAKLVMMAGMMSAILVGCSSTGGYVPGEGGSVSNGDPLVTGKPLPGSRYSMRKDAAPVEDVDVRTIPNAVPKYEPYSRGGNKSPYKVWGKTYHILDTHEGYKETGYASWYGRKFHGHKTSNGEIYDMYGMTAAHKSLPIPSYVKVTNIENGREVIVRVNDRGPFHSDRIVDLSYAAAKKLGYKDKGTAKVRLEAISVSQRRTYAVPSSPVENNIVTKPLKPTVTGGKFFVQVGAFDEKVRADNFLKDVRSRLGMSVSLHKDGFGMFSRHKVFVGPFRDRSEAEKHLETIKRQGFFGSFIAKK